MKTTMRYTHAQCTETKEISFRLSQVHDLFSDICSKTVQILTDINVHCAIHILQVFCNYKLNRKLAFFSYQYKSCEYLYPILLNITVSLVFIGRA